jgi:hypothetical protein
MITYIFRKPKYPVLCSINGFVIAARSEKTFLKQLLLTDVDSEKSYDLVDSTNEGWMFTPKEMMISPLTFKKSWTKKEIIALYNGRKNRADDCAPYSEKSLSSKRLDILFQDIVALLLKT